MYLNSSVTKSLEIKIVRTAIKLGNLWSSPSVSLSEVWYLSIFKGFRVSVLNCFCFLYIQCEMAAYVTDDRADFWAYPGYTGYDIPHLAPLSSGSFSFRFCATSMPQVSIYLTSIYFFIKIYFYTRRILLTLICSRWRVWPKLVRLFRTQLFLTNGELTLTETKESFKIIEIMKVLHRRSSFASRNWGFPYRLGQPGVETWRNETFISRISVTGVHFWTSKSSSTDWGATSIACGLCRGIRYAGEVCWMGKPNFHESNQWRPICQIGGGANFEIAKSPCAQYRRIHAKNPTSAKVYWTATTVDCACKPVNFVRLGTVAGGRENEVAPVGAKWREDGRRRCAR